MSSSVSDSPTSVAAALTCSGVGTWTAMFGLLSSGTLWWRLRRAERHVAAQHPRLSSLGVWITARDKRQGGLRALPRMARCHVIGIPWQHEQLGVRNGLLPGTRVVHTRQATALRGDHQCGTGNVGQLSADVRARDGRHEADLRRGRGAAHELCPPGHPLWWKCTPKAMAHALLGPALDPPRLLEGLDERWRTLRSAHAVRRRCPHHGQRAHACRPPRCKGARDRATDLGANHMEALHTQGIHEAAEVVNDEVQGPGEISRHGRGGPEAAHVWAHDTIPGRQVWHPAIPCRTTLGVAVEHEDRGGRTPGIGVVVHLVMHVQVGWSMASWHGKVPLMACSRVVAKTSPE